MGKTLYLECSAGISGDMFVAALLDLGADEQKLRKALDSLPADGFTVQIKRVKKAALDTCSFDVLLDEQHENHDHDMAYLHGHEAVLHEEDHHEGEHHEGDHHEEDYHHHPHEHRSLEEILAMIERADLTPHARELAEKIFHILGEAEAKAHGVPIGEVHFHEVGAVDSIADIVAAAVCMDDLEITDVVIGALCEGHGTVRSQHGILPVPVPAVCNIVSACQLDLHIMDEQGEFITPTGAAIAAAIRTSGKLPEQFRIIRTGLGAGKRNYRIPSLLRAHLIEACTQSGQADRIWKLECNLDDCSGEVLGYVSDLLFEAGARDVHYIPVYMKKNRPGIQLNVICSDEVRESLEQLIFLETTTIGIRRYQMERSILPRRQEKIMTKYGEILVKVCTLPDGTEKRYPEYESVKAAALLHHCTFQEIFQNAAGESN